MTQEFITAIKFLFNLIINSIKQFYLFITEILPNPIDIIKLLIKEIIKIFK